MDELKQMKQSDIEVVRKNILKNQGGLCAICFILTDKPCLDHQHKKRIGGTGQIRGVLCSACNVFLAKVENNASRFGITKEDLPEVLRSMGEYLDREQYPLIHPSEAPKPKKLKKSSYTKLVKTLKTAGYKKKIPDYPKSGKLTKGLGKLYHWANLDPDYYK